MNKIFYEKRYANYLFNLNSHLKYRLTGSLLYPSYYNPPLPRIKPQPIEIHYMIRRRLLKRHQRLAALRLVNSNLQDLSFEADFFRSLDLDFSGDYYHNLLSYKQYLLNKLDDDYKRSQMKFSIKDLQRFSRFHQKRKEMREKSIQWRKQNHPRLIAHWKSHVQVTKDARRKAKQASKEKVSERSSQNPVIKTFKSPRTPIRLRKHVKNTPSKVSFQAIFDTPLKDVYKPNSYNDQPATKITYDYTKPPQPLLTGKLANTSKWSKCNIK